MKEKENKKRTIITICIISVIILVIFLLIFNYHINIHKSKKKESSNSKYIEENIKINKKGKYIGYCSLGITNYLDINIKFPKIVIQKEGAQKLNQIMTNDYENILSFASEDIIDENDHKKSTTLIINTWYNTLLENDIIYIFINSEYIFPMLSAHNHPTNYYYDIKNDKILTFDEVLKYTNYTIKDFTKVNRKIKDISDCHNKCGFKIKKN